MAIKISGTTVFDDSRNLVNLNTGAVVGVQSGGNVVGAGATTLNFIGTGNTFSYNAGTKTLDISISSGSGGGGVSISAETSNQNQYITYATSFGSTTSLGSTTGLVYNPGLNFLGIGTTSAKAPLHVVDNILVSAGVASTTDFIIKAYTDNSGSLSFEQASSGLQVFSLSLDSTGNLFQVNDNTLIPALSVTSSGITSCPAGFTSGIGSAVRISVSGSNLVFTVVGIGSTSFTLA